MSYWLVLLLIIVVDDVVEASNHEDDISLLVLAMRNRQTDSFHRFLKNGQRLGFHIQEVELSSTLQCRGTDEGQESCPIDQRFSRDSSKVEALMKQLRTFKDETKKVIMVVDSSEDYDVLLASSPKEILKQFLQFQARIVFSNDRSCWPEESLEDLYPENKRGHRYLNSGAFIGYAPNLYDLLMNSAVQVIPDEQLYFTKIYLNRELRDKHQMKIDHTSKIFHNLNISSGSITMLNLNGNYLLHNQDTSTTPLVIRGDKEFKEYTYMLGDYLGSAYNLEDGCYTCEDNVINLENVKDEDLPSVLMGVFIEEPTPFFVEFLEHLEKLDYPKQKLDLYVHMGDEYNSKDMEEYLEQHKNSYKSIKYISAEDNLEEWQAREDAAKLCIKQNCDYHLTLDSTAHLHNPKALKLLIQQNRPILSPFLPQPYGDTSNIKRTMAMGRRKKGFDEENIMNGKVKGLWNVPYISAAYLIRASMLQSQDIGASYQRQGDKKLDPTSAFCENMKDKGIFMYVTNRFDFGHLVVTDTFNTSLVHSELYEAESNGWDWERRYIVHNHSQNLNFSLTIEQPCSDVFWFPVTTPRFCKELIEVAEAADIWAAGAEYNKGGKIYYDAVPTKDIEMENLELKDTWMVLLRQYIHPVVERVFEGYTNSEVTSNTDFIVQYRAEEQADLRPHFDSSLYSVNMGLNSPPNDYEGGGTRFPRYNCSVTATRVGWVLVHPSALTHKHQGLPTTKGTRYILVSFVDNH